MDTGNKEHTTITPILGAGNDTPNLRFYIADYGFTEAMDKRKASAVFTIFVGLLMMGMWSMLVLTNQVPYLDTPQMEIKLHILTEIVTAVMLIIGGISVLRYYDKLTNLHYISQGMLIYAIINSSGYYIDMGEPIMAVVFGVLLLGTILSLSFFMK
jgi:hypothetical protein